MLRVRTVVLVGLVWLLASPRGQADLFFTANLNGLQEVGPNASTATGTASFVLNDPMTQLTMSVVINGIDVNGTQTPGSNLDNLTNAHIHAAPPGVNGGVVWGFIGAPFNDNNPTDTVVTPFPTGVGFTVTSKWDAPEGNAGQTLTSQLTNLINGGTYINFHTVQFGGGEIRGQITVVPEPSVITLCSIATAGFVASRIRRWRTPR
jgi:hypothetical protein